MPYSLIGSVASKTSLPFVESEPFPMSPGDIAVVGMAFQDIPGFTVELLQHGSGTVLSTFWASSLFVVTGKLYGGLAHSPTIAAPNIVRVRITTPRDTQIAAAVLSVQGLDLSASNDPLRTNGKEIGRSASTPPVHVLTGYTVACHGTLGPIDDPAWAWSGAQFVARSGTTGRSAASNVTVSLAVSDIESSIAASGSITRTWGMATATFAQ